MPDIVDLIQLARNYEQELPPMPELKPEPRGAEIARLLDHTILKPETTAGQVVTLCREAKEYGFAGVCINPAFVSLAAGLLAGSPVAVCTVVGFPLGATLPSYKAMETLACMDAGAAEIDVVLNIGALKGQAYGLVLNEVCTVVDLAHNSGAIVKVILENALLSRQEKIIACVLCKAAGADFVKTSTGFSTSGATVKDVALMRQVVGSEVGVKAAGGVRSYADVMAMVRAGANRIGTSSGVKILQEAGVFGG